MNIFYRFHERLQQAIVNHLGWQSLRPVQELAGEAILDGQNVIILAPTAGGKTEAAFFPILSRLVVEQIEGVKCIYLSPLRALLNNQEERLGIYTQMLGLSRFKWHGEAKPGQKKAFINDPADILMITPESLEVMLISSKVPANKLFCNLRFVVIDEIHALADCDRGGHMLSVLERLKLYTDYDFQRISLSATVGNPKQILDWAQGSSHRAKKIINPPQPLSPRRIEIKYLDSLDLPGVATQCALNNKSLFFCNSRSMTEKVAKAMATENIQIFVHHSSISREERQIAEEAMSQDSNTCIICTSTLELGIDVGELDKIFQAECPDTVSSFLQRMGRTGRREGSKMNTTFFTTSSESILQAIALIELAKNHWIEKVKLNDRAWHLLVHQLFAMCLQHGYFSRAEAWNVLSKSFCFKGIKQEEFHQLVDHMIRNFFLFEESGRLSMGIEAEKLFGRKNFMQMYSVFSSPQGFEVKTIGGRELGTIEGQFADTLEENDCFLLVGSSWLVKRIELDKRAIWVTKAPGGKAPKWGGFTPKFLSYELCRKMYDILTSDDIYPYCDENAKAKLDTIREDKSFLRENAASFEKEGNHIFWWTYAGGRINITLNYAFAHLSGFKGSANNYYLKCEDNSASIQSLNKLIDQMKQDGFWEADEVRQSLIKMLPKHRLSKFQHCLPERYQMELIANEFLDIPGAKKFLSMYED